MPRDKDSLGDVLEAARRSKTVSSAAFVAIGWAAKGLAFIGWALVMRALTMPTLHDIDVRVTPVSIVAEEAKSAAKSAADGSAREVDGLWTAVIELEATRQGFSQGMANLLVKSYHECVLTNPSAAKSACGESVLQVIARGPQR